MKKKEAIQIEMVTNGFLIRPAFHPGNTNTEFSPDGDFYVFNELSGNALGSPSVFEFLEQHFQVDTKAK